MGEQFLKILLNKSLSKLQLILAPRQWYSFVGLAVLNQKAINGKLIQIFLNIAKGLGLELLVQKGQKFFKDSRGFEKFFDKILGESFRVENVLSAFFVLGKKKFSKKLKILRLLVPVEVNFYEDDFFLVV